MKTPLSRLPGPALAAGLVAWLAMGCGVADEGPQRHTVRGTVTLDGKPLSDGAVTFQPASPGAYPEGAALKQGRFTLRAVQGSYRVAISAARPVPGLQAPTGMGPVVAESLPARYNTETTLTADVKPGGPRDFTYDLRSEP
jgi:hypothetical protein